MTTEQAYFLTVALINIVLAFSGSRIKDPAGKQKSIRFFIAAFSANFLSWFLYVFNIGIILQVVSVVLASVFIWGMVVFSYKRCECHLPLTLISIIFSINCLILSYFTYTGQHYRALHVSAFFVPLAFLIISYLFLKRKKHRNPSDIILAYACIFMAIIVAARSLLLEFEPEIFSATIISSQIIWPAFSVISGVFSLLSFTEEAQLKLQKESNTDQLTGLANRRSMEYILTKEWARANRHERHLSLVMFDVDFFKNFNDHYGHQAGDVCLKKVAKTLQQSGQRAGDLAVRYGGEEFLLILPDTDILTAQEIAENIRKSISSVEIPHLYSPLGILTLSAGVAVLSNNNYRNIGELIQAADSALYQAKESGRNQVQLALNTKE